MRKEDFQGMGKPKSGRPGAGTRPAGPSEITYTETGLTEEVEGSAPSLDDLPPGRREKIERIRKEIQGGKYETREKLERAIEKLLEDVS